MRNAAISSFIVVAIIAVAPAVDCSGGGDSIDCHSALGSRSYPLSVIDKVTGLAICDATVNGNPASSDGGACLYTVNVDDDRYSVTVSRPGYRAVTFNARRDGCGHLLSDQRTQVALEPL